jgi:hypothetical protein
VKNTKNDGFTVCCLRSDELQFLNIFSVNRAAILYSADLLYRMNTKSFPDYKYLLQENYVEYIFFFKM